VLSVGLLLSGALVLSMMWREEQADRAASFAPQRPDGGMQVSRGLTQVSPADSREEVSWPRSGGVAGAPGGATADPGVPVGRNRRRLPPGKRIRDRVAQAEPVIAADPDAPVLREVYPKGAAWTECPLVDGKRHGTARAWCPDGTRWTAPTSNPLEAR
jgi:hypothetical protein